MKRQLTAREWILLGVLGVLLVVSGYILLFYKPMMAERDRCISETETCRMQIEALRQRVQEKQRMERELEMLFAGAVPPLSIPDYDNLNAVMFELNNILDKAQDFSLSFSTVDTSQIIVRRSISLKFDAGGYETARLILQRLHDSDYRCMMDNVNIDFEKESAGISVGVTIVFFEYQD